MKEELEGGLEVGVCSVQRGQLEQGPGVKAREWGAFDHMEMFRGDWSTRCQRDNGTDETGEAGRVLPQSSHGKSTSRRDESRHGVHDSEEGKITRSSGGRDEDRAAGRLAVSVRQGGGVTGMIQRVQQDWQVYKAHGGEREKPAQVSRSQVMKGGP